MAGARVKSHAPGLPQLSLSEPPLTGQGRNEGYEEAAAVEGVAHQIDDLTVAVVHGIGGALQREPLGHHRLGAQEPGLLSALVDAVPWRDTRQRIDGPSDPVEALADVKEPLPDDDALARPALREGNTVSCCMNRCMNNRAAPWRLSTHSHSATHSHTRAPTHPHTNARVAARPPPRTCTRVHARTRARIQTIQTHGCANRQRTHRQTRTQDT
eukprot:10906875-Alexandrium_andersonii.AAC.1